MNIAHFIYQFTTQPELTVWVRRLRCRLTWPRWKNSWGPSFGLAHGRRRFPGSYQVITFSYLVASSMCFLMLNSCLTRFHKIAGHQAPNPNPNRSQRGGRTEYHAAVCQNIAVPHNEVEPSPKPIETLYKDLKDPDVLPIHRSRGLVSRFFLSPLACMFLFHRISFGDSWTTRFRGRLLLRCQASTKIQITDSPSALTIH